jgi:hypothetical protein
LITITFGEVFKLWNSPLCNFLHPPVTTPIFDPNKSILLSTLFSKLSSPRRHVQIESGAHPSSYPTGTGGSFPWGRMAGP